MLDAKPISRKRAFKVGIDLVEVRKVKKVFASGAAQQETVFTPREIRSAMRERDPFLHLAGYFAAKEATFKVLGTGLSEGMEWQDVEVRQERSGKVRLSLRGKSARLAHAMQVTEQRLSLSLSGEYAAALVLLVLKA
jgi:holo-[acyl-carrier protein] synthase